MSRVINTVLFFVLSLEKVNFMMHLSYSGTRRRKIFFFRVQCFLHIDTKDDAAFFSSSCYLHNPSYFLLFFFFKDCNIQVAFYFRVEENYRRLYIRFLFSTVSHLYLLNVKTTCELELSWIVKKLPEFVILSIFSFFWYVRLSFLSTLPFEVI